MSETPSNSENSPSELPPEELSQEEVKKRLETLQNCLRLLKNSESSFRKTFKHVDYKLKNIGENDLALEALKIIFYDRISVLKDLYDSGKGVASGQYHDSATRYPHQSRLSLGDLIEKDDDLFFLMQEFGRLFALEMSLNGMHERASGIYKDLGDVEKAEMEAKIKDGEHNENEEEEGKSFSLAVEEFFEKTKEKSLFKSKEERDAALEKLKQDIEDKINAIK